MNIGQMAFHLSKAIKQITTINSRVNNLHSDMDKKHYISYISNTMQSQAPSYSKRTVCCKQGRVDKRLCGENRFPRNQFLLGCIQRSELKQMITRYATVFLKSALKGKTLQPKQKDRQTRPDTPSLQKQVYRQQLHNWFPKQYVFEATEQAAFLF